jgi:hypothetical protein
LSVGVVLERIGGVVELEVEAVVWDETVVESVASAVFGTEEG